MSTPRVLAHGTEFAQAEAEADLSHIVSIGVGGAAAPLALLETYAAKGVALQQRWGITETGPLGLVLPSDEALRTASLSPPA